MAAPETGEIVAEPPDAEPRFFRATENFGARGAAPASQLLFYEKGDVVGHPNGEYLYARGCPLEPIEDEAPAPRK